MIQRIQSLFLIIAAVACILLFFIPFGNYYNPEIAIVRFDVRGIHHISPDPQELFNKYLVIIPFIFNIAIMGLSFWAFYSFKERTQQLKLVRFAVMANIIFVAIIFYFCYSLENQLKVPTQYNYFGICLPLLSLVMLILAYRAINKDDKLVRAADRLR